MVFEVRYPFGVELEFADDKVSSRSLNNYFSQALAPLGVSPSNREEATVWTIKGDGSCGHEVTTPILHTQEDLNNLRDVVGRVQQSHGDGSLVDRRCGLHVHFDTGSFSRSQLLAILHGFAKCEGMIYSILPSNRRGNNYCSSLRNWANGDNRRIPTEHGLAVNMGGWHRRGDLEVRYGAGTCDKNKVYGWVSLLQGLIHKFVSGHVPAQSINNVQALKSWILEVEGEGFAPSEIDNTIFDWLDLRAGGLLNDSPAARKRAYTAARGIRDHLPKHHQKFHFNIRKEMSKDEKRAHDREIIARDGNGTLLEWEIPEAFIKEYEEKTLKSAQGKQKRAQLMPSFDDGWCDDEDECDEDRCDEE